MENSTNMTKKIGELLKIEITIISTIYVVLSLIPVVISSHNDLLFNLSSPEKPNHFIPYAPIYKNLIVFTVLNLMWILIGFFGLIFDARLEKHFKKIIISNFLFFISSIICFICIIFRYSNSFTF